MTEIVKAGWLMKQTSFLKRWKKHWFSLSLDGYFRLFENPNDSVAKSTLLIPRDVIAIKTGQNVVECKPPDGSLSDHLIQLVQRREKSWFICAESLDDMLAWQLALEQSRVVNQPRVMPNNNGPQLPVYLDDVINYNPNGGYPMYYRGNYQGNYPSRIIYTPQGPVTVIYINDGYYRYGRGCGGYGCGYGALGGAALASAFLLPFWFPLFWFF